jgi:putative ABC transport system substrate-binding protein
VEVGLVGSLARPGGNVTGVTYGVDADIFGKQLELLKEVIPKVRRVAALSNPGNSPAQPLIMSSVKGAARSLGLQLQLVEARGPGEFEDAFAAMAKERAGALLVTGDPMFFLHRARLADLAVRNRLLTMSTQGQWVEAGGTGMATGGPAADGRRRHRVRRAAGRGSRRAVRVADPGRAGRADRRA